jgi:L-threonylcarbamoyladenylate synthase
MSNNEILYRAVTLVRNGGVIIYPTETVYGIGCDPYNSEACQRICRIKGREETKPFILLAWSLTQVEECTGKLSGTAHQLAKAFWPGPLTIVIKPLKHLPVHIIGPSGGVAFRVTSHPIAVELAQGVGSPLISTSANKTGYPPVTTYEEACALFRDDVDMILEGQQTIMEKSSTIIDLTFSPPRILREGCISRDEIMRFV